MSFIQLSHRPQPSPAGAAARIEGLEFRVLFATFTVTTTADDGPGSLRQAIEYANAGFDTIAFDIPGGGVHTISPLSPLPLIKRTVAIDGSTQPGYAGTPLIELDGSGAGPAADGLTFSTEYPRTVVRGLAVNGFGGNGIAAGNEVTVEGCYVGLAPEGIAARPNGAAGILLAGAGVTIGGPTPAQRNVISGNRGPGISGGGFVSILGNYIGTDATGTVDLGNGGDGVTLTDAHAATVHGNLISGNGGDGLHLVRASAGVNNVGGNFIGTNAAGTAALGNDGDGVYLLDCGDGYTVGVRQDPFLLRAPGLDPGAPGRNVISGNGGHGVHLASTWPQRTHAQVAYNYIGTDATGTKGLGNAGSGVFIESGGAIIGDQARAQGNLISGNGGDGVTIARPAYPTPSHANALVQFNRIGITADGGPLGNAGHGVAVLGSDWVVIGGNRGPQDGNTIAYNGRAGVWVSGATADKVWMASNTIYSNALLEIDLGGDGVTPNDEGDADTGPNRLLNYPVVEEVAVAPPSAPSLGSVARFTLSAEPRRLYRVEFFAAPAADASGHGGAARWVGATTVTTDAAGNAAAVTPLSPVQAGEFVSATTTDVNSITTSEFSAAVEAMPKEVFARHVFYNHSAYDGSGPGADVRDDGAVAAGKFPLAAPGALSWLNATNSIRGLNGVMVDVTRLPEGAAPGADDFEFRRGPGDSAATWTDAPAPSEIAVRRGAGVGGSDRITLVWPDAGDGPGAAVADAWLQVTMKATSDTGLSRPDVFYFGNLVGGAQLSGPSKVDAGDVEDVRRNLHKVRPAEIDSYDFDKNGRIDARDLAAVRRNLGHTLGSLTAVPPPSTPASSVVLGGSPLFSERSPLERPRAYVPE